MMEKIAFIEPKSLAKSVGLVTLGLTVLFVTAAEIEWIFLSVTQKQYFPEMMLTLGFLPIIPSLAYMLGWLIATLYNWSARRTGGLRIRLESEQE